MNYDFMQYYLGHMANSTSLSMQCMKVRNLMLADAKRDQERLERIQQFLDGKEPIQVDTVEWLKRAIRGQYGSEGYTLDVSFVEEAAFWHALHRAYPEHARLLWIAADAQFMASRYVSPYDYTKAFEMFFQAFALDPTLIYGLDGGVWAEIQASPFRLKYDLIHIDLSIHEGYDELDELVDEIRADFVGDVDALRAIDDVLRKYGKLY